MCFNFHPLSINSFASQSSNSGCVGFSPWLPKSLGVATMPRPKWCCHSRFTITRAKSRPAPSSTSVIQFASDRRRYDVRQPGGGATCQRFSASGTFGISTCRKLCVATPSFWLGSPRFRKCVCSRKSPPCVWKRIAGTPSLQIIALTVVGAGAFRAYSSTLPFNSRHCGSVVRNQRSRAARSASVGL